MHPQSLVVNYHQTPKDLRAKAMISLLGDDLELLIQLGKGILQTGKVLPIKRKIYSGKAFYLAASVDQHIYIPFREKDLIKICDTRHHSLKGK